MGSPERMPEHVRAGGAADERMRTVKDRLRGPALEAIRAAIAGDPMCEG